MTHVLLVEDEAALAEPLAFLLERESFTVTWVENGPDALTAFANQQIDIVLLDLMLPGMSGTEVCRKLRETSSVPVIMVTARDAEIDKVVGLEMGADDYVTKPYSSRELVARIRAVLRRGSDDRGEHAAAAPDEPLQGGRVVLDATRHVVTVAGQEVSMPLKEFELLEYLMANSGKVLTRNQLINEIWGSDYVGDTKTLDVHIKRLRAKIELEPKRPTQLLTIRGLGYKFEA